jgi:tetratricopeptide (TPR) repeat protein
MPDRSSEAVEMQRKAVALCEQLTVKAPTSSQFRDQLAISSNSLGESLARDDQNIAAEEAFRQALALKRQLAAEFPAVPEYLRGVAISLNNLGIVYKNTERFDEAEQVYREALTIHEQLMKDYPGLPDHQNEVAGAMANLARLRLLNHKELDVARRLLEEALPHHEAVLRASPGHPVYRNFCRLNRWRLAETLLELKQHAAAAEAAEQFLQVSFEMPRDAYTAAGLLAGCARLAADDEQLTQRERQQRATAYAESALSALRQAVDKGFTDVAQLKQDPTLDPLRSRAEFQQLVADLEATNAP